MEKRTLYALIAVVALGAVAFAVMRAPEKGQRQGPPPRPIAEVKPVDVSRLELTNDKQEKTVLEKTSATEWRVKQPGDWKADQQGVKQVLDGLEKLQFHDTASENADKHDELGVAEGKGARLVAKDVAGKTLADLFIGKSVGGYTMVRVAGKNEVWQAGGLYPYVVGRAPAGWRDHAIFEFAADDVERLGVEAPGSKLVLEKLAPADKDAAKAGVDTKWKVVEASGNAPKADDLLDDGQVNAVVQGLSNLHAADFADDKQLAEVKGAGAALTVSATVKGKLHTLYVGAEKGEDVYVATPDSSTVYTIKKYSLDHIAKKPIDYRDKTIVKAKEADLASVDITDAGETSTLTQGKDGSWTLAKGSADPAKVKPAISAFDKFQASSFADEKDPSKLGLSKPRGQAVLHLKNKSAVTIKVGATTKDGDYYVQKVGTPEVYLVKKYAVDRWLKKTAELTTAAKK